MKLVCLAAMALVLFVNCAVAENGDAPNLIKEQSKGAKLSYLADVYATHGNRYGDEDDYSFSFNVLNAWQKANEVAELLKEFSCKNVEVENLNIAGPGYRGAPNFFVTFVPSPEIIKLFRTVSKELNGKDRINRWVTK